MWCSARPSGGFIKFPATQEIAVKLGMARLRRVVLSRACGTRLELLMRTVANREKTGRAEGKALPRQRAAERLEEQRLRPPRARRIGPLRSQRVTEAGIAPRSPPSRSISDGIQLTRKEKAPLLLCSNRAQSLFPGPHVFGRVRLSMPFLVTFTQYCKSLRGKVG